jgi:CMP-N,N'-diacetyllegionaminic acid synthase
LRRKRILALIPARSGSKGIPNKNILKLENHPLLAWSIRAAKLTPEISDIVVSTDSLEYQKIAQSYGADVPFLRPSTISGDVSTDFEFIKHTLDYYKNLKIYYDLVVHLRPTTPLRNPQVLSAAISEFISSGDRNTALRSVHETSESMYKGFEVNQNGNLMTIFDRNCNVEVANNPRQSFPKTYVANGYVDILRPNIINENGFVHGDNVLAFKTESISELDMKSDIDFVKFELKSNNLYKQRLWS